jgi:RNA polymerase sigma factor (sigma-70 family)
VTITAEDIALARGAGRSIRKSIPFRVTDDDLASCAYVALLKAIPTWDPARFDRRGFLWRRIRQRVIDELRGEDEVQRAGSAQPQFVSDEGRGRCTDANQETEVLHAEIRSAVDSLPPRLAKVIRMRYYDEQTQEEVGRAFNVTPGQISHLEKSALAELRGKLA